MYISQRRLKMNTIPRRQITCINKINHHNPYERIHRIGGIENSKVWRMSVSEAIKAIDNEKFSFFVDVDEKEVDVIVVKRGDNRYLRTAPDDETKNNLLDLEDCNLWD
jgi:hypothetical protein